PSPSPFFVTSPPPTVLYTLSLHDALPISAVGDVAEVIGGSATVDVSGKYLREPRVIVKSLAARLRGVDGECGGIQIALRTNAGRDRKSTRLNSSHLGISYAVFCLKKKKTK